MKFALAQINSGLDVAANLSRVHELSRKAAEAGAEFVIFPEAMMSAFGSRLREVALAHADSWKASLTTLSAEVGITILVGEFGADNAVIGTEQTAVGAGETAVETDRAVAGARGTAVDAEETAVDAEGLPKVVNLLAVYSPDGQRHEYAKIHLYDAFGFKESDTVAAGSEPLVVDVGDTRVGVAICYDIRFPKLFAELSRAGAQLTVVAASWGAGPGKVEQWQLLARARALDSNMVIAALDQADPVVSGVEVPSKAPTGVGHSLVADPFGRVLVSLDGAESLEIVDVDLAVTEEAVATIPVLANARLGY